ncbi:MAG TPA: hypothetical protein ENF83_01420 [Candidatus Korarchaeota archaeon]|nr:hypothetical protein [Candidatus Korarchaeota archaeon]
MVGEVAEEDAVMAALLELARRRAEEKVQEAKKRAKEIVEGARREAERIIEARRARALREMEEEIERKRSAAEVDARKILMEVETRYVQEAIDRAKDALNEVVEGKYPGVDYREVLARLAEEAVRGVGEEEVYLMGREADRGILREIAEDLSKKLGVTVKVDETALRIVGGVVARDAQDKKRFYNTIEGRLRRVQEEKFHEIAALLFGR